MKISEQAMGAIMMALQKSLVEQTDIVPVLREFDFQVNQNEELIVTNPPIFKFDSEEIFEEGKEEGEDVLGKETIKTVGSD